MLRMFVAIALACMLTACTPPRAETQSNPLLRAPDHVLVWSQTAGEADRVFSALGFHVREGQTYPEGISSATVTFADWSYLELLHFSAPDRARGSIQASIELAFVSEGPGANSFSVEVSDADAAAAFLRERGFPVGAIVPDMVDPDGAEGPLPSEPASWRDFHFETSPLAGVDLFFIQYPAEEIEESPSAPSADFAARTTHENGAQRLSAVWLLVPDLDAEAAHYERMGFELGPPIAVAHLNGQSRIATLGEGAIVLVQSERLPQEFVAPRREGPRIIGLSFEVADLKAARSVLRRAPSLPASTVNGPLGQALLIQTTSQLGLFVELHGADG